MSGSYRAMSGPSEQADPLDRIHFVLRELSPRIDEATSAAQGNPNTPPSSRSPIAGQLEDLAGQVAQIRRVRGVVEGEYRVGVFGVSKRGKSSLLNALLGVSLLPVHKVPATAVEIEVCHDPTLQADRYRVMDSTSAIPDVVKGVKAANNRLKQVAVRQSSTEHVRTRVTVQGVFSNSALLREGCARFVVDTPGADGLISMKDPRAVAEGQCALAAMRELDAVLFCVRLDLLKHMDDLSLFKTHCVALRPIIAATHLDAWDHESDAAEQVADMFEVPVDRVVCIDAKAASTGKSRSRQPIDKLVSLIEGAVHRGQSTDDDVEMALRQLDFVLHAEAMRSLRGVQWPRAAWGALKTRVSGRAAEILTRIEQRRDRSLGG
jgi:GTPase Era involved in 16S rRNA processing